MLEINLLTESDRDRWEWLARDKDTYFELERSDDDYERTWRRLLDDEQVRGIGARQDGRMVGIAHYLYWNTLEDAPARGLYDKVGRLHQGLILYTYRRDANLASTQR
ncbi:hypothetical protein [Nonomuraea longispora]|nr:hypothetical protein [Nonomuraea longispora]